MIKIYDIDNKLIDTIIDISKASVIEQIIEYGRFEYECFEYNEIKYNGVDFDDRIIRIKLSGKKRENIFDKYSEIHNNCLYQTCQLFAIHKRTEQKINFKKHKNVPLWFLDEIHFIGIIFVESIKLVDKDNMLIQHKESKPKSSDYTEDRIVSEYEKTSAMTADMQSSIPLIEDKERNDTWWHHPKETDIHQSFESRPAIIELMGCFIKDKHTIYICEDNIDYMKKLLLHRDMWFSTDEKFYDLIVLHEIGHSVFQYIGFDSLELIKNETRANYFASLITNGFYDDKIKLLTIFQPFIYRFPYLSLAYMIKSFSPKEKYEKVITDYYKMAGVLYEGF